MHEVLTEIPRVRADLGYPPLVTPTSQIVGTQAVLNTLFGERYKQVTKETKGVVLGQYGQTPAPISAEVLAKIGGGEKQTTGRPADDLEAELEKARAEIGGMAKSDEDLLSYVLFPAVAKEFFDWRDGGDELELENSKLAAAITVALSQSHAHAAPAPATNGHSHDPWKMKGRRRGLRG